MPLLKIEGVEVDFPKEPYQCQLDYMKKVIFALKSGNNALLESPTGTGKTLCLLCSCLAWQKHMRAVNAQNAVIYASRTHSQLAQVVSELRFTIYRPRIAVLGSRDQLCVHEKVSKMPRTALSHACNHLTSRRACSYQNNLENYQGAAEGVGDAPSPLLDIEDLVRLGARDHVCPYFYSRDASERADLVLAPYNYLLDPSVCGTLRLAWQQAVVIFDEAHNIEKIASEAASFVLSSADIATCIQELQQTLRDMRDQPEIISGGNSRNSSSSSSGHLLPHLGSTMRGRDAPSLNGTVELLKSLFALERSLDRVPLKPGGVGPASSCVLPGEWLVQVLLSVGFTHAMAEDARRCGEYLLERGQELMAASFSGGGATGAPPAEPKVIPLSHALDKVLQSGGGIAPLEKELILRAKDYKVYICEEGNKGRSDADAFSAALSGMGRVSAAGAHRRVLHYWAFSPGVAMEELKRRGARCVLLTSGTLAPLDSFREDLKISFPVELVNPHVIKPSQIWVGAVASGAGGRPLNSSYAMRGKPEYKDELGESVLAICQAAQGRGTSRLSVQAYSGPSLQGGILVFFPSYTALEQCSDRWKETGLWERLRSQVSALVVEERAGNNNKAATANSADKTIRHAVAAKTKNAQLSLNISGKKAVGDVDHAPQSSPIDDSTEKKYISELIEQLDAALSKYGSCLLLAVCRGKVSEGIDFSDNRGRIVIVTGLPYAPYLDPWVVLKKQFLDEKCSIPSNNPAPIQGTDGAVTISQRRLNGAGWYAQTAARAVNQAVGRVIRHKNDWGAIFLLDDRFCKPQQIAQLSGWVRPSVQCFSALSVSLQGFRCFVNAALADDTLTPNIKTEASKAVVRRVPPSFVKSQPTVELFTRQVVIPREQLDQLQSADNSYVSPELLLTQQSQLEVNDRDLVDNMMQMISNQKNTRNLSQRIDTPSGNIMTASNSKSNISQFFATKAKNDVVTKPLGSSFSGIALASSKRQLETVGKQATDHERRQKELKLYLSDANFTAINQLNSASPLLDRHDIAVSWANSQSTSNLSANVNMIKVKVQTNREFINKLISLSHAVSIPISDPNSLERIVTTMLTKSKLGLDEVDKFISDIIGSVSCLLPNLKAEVVLMELNMVLAVEWREYFRSSMSARFLSIVRKNQRKVRDSCTQPLPNDEEFRTSQDNIFTHESKKVKSTTEFSAELDNENNRHWQPSNRMKLASNSRLMSTIKQSTEPGLKSDVLPSCKVGFAMSLFAKINDSKKKTSETPMMMCAVCREVTADPCAARCGHVCCPSCWQKVLKKKNVDVQSLCPVCRSVIDAKSISRLKL